MVKDAETGQRGYLLTGNDRYLEPYNDSVALLPRELETTRRLVVYESQLMRLSKLERLLAEKLSELQKTVALRKAGDADGALKLVVENHGEDVMDCIRAAIDEMKGAQQALLEQRSRDWKEAASRSVLITWIGSGFSSSSSARRR